MRETVGIGFLAGISLQMSFASFAMRLSSAKVRVLKYEAISGFLLELLSGFLS